MLGKVYHPITILIANTELETQNNRSWSQCKALKLLLLRAVLAKFIFAYIDFILLPKALLPKEFEQKLRKKSQAEVVRFFA